MKQTLRFLIFATLCCILQNGYAQVYTYTTNTTGAVSATIANTTATGLTRVNGVTAPGSPCNTGFSATNFGATTTYATTLGAIEATVTAAAGYQLSVTGFSADMRRSGTGPASVRFAYSTDGGTTWTDKGSNDAPPSASCGSTATFTWATTFTVAPSTPLKVRIYGFNASGTGGTFQVQNLLVNGTVTSANTITTGAASFGPYCAISSNTISVPFTTQGTFTDSFYVQISDASGVFPANATSNLIGAGTTTSPASATISGLPAGSGYRVRVVNTTAGFYASGTNGSNIVLNPTLVPGVVITTSPTAACPGTAVVFTATPTNGGTTPTYQWFYHGVAAGTGATYTNSALINNDSVYVVLTSNATCATPTTATSNVLHVTVYPTATSSSSTTLCPGASIAFGGSTISTAGTYYDTLQTVHGCDSAVTLTVQVLNTIRDTTRVLVCQGDAYLFHGASYTTAGTYSDSLSCDSIATLVLGYKTVRQLTAAASICQGDVYTYHGTTYTAAGTYADTLSCDTIVALTITYKAVRQIAVSGTICQGDAFVYHGTTYTTAGTYRDTISCDTIVTLTITANAKPTATATLTGATSLSTTAFATYHWLLNGTAIAGATSQNYTATQNGNYSVYVTDANGCSDTSNVIAITTIAISEVNTLAARIYPNPTESVLYIDADGLQHAELIDVVGRTMMSVSISGSHAQIDLSSLTGGMYTLVIRGAENAVSIRNIVKK